MQVTPKGYVCSRCRNELVMEVVEIRRIEEQAATPVDFADEESEADRTKVSQECPRCGNAEAFKTASFVSGEHAGVRRERSIQRFKCTKCHYSWAVD